MLIFLASKVTPGDPERGEASSYPIEISKMWFAEEDK